MRMNRARAMVDIPTNSINRIPMTEALYTTEEAPNCWDSAKGLSTRIRLFIDDDDER